MTMSVPRLTLTYAYSSRIGSPRRGSGLVFLVKEQRARGATREQLAQHLELVVCATVPRVYYRTWMMLAYFYFEAVQDVQEPFDTASTRTLDSLR